MQPVSLFDEALIPADVNVPIGMRARPLRLDDYSKGFLQLLEQLTSVGHVSQSDFEQRFMSMKEAKSYYIVVLEDIELERVAAAATLVIEFKFIHNAGSRGRVEDVVVDQQFRGQKLGAVLNNILVDMAKKIGVYKLSLECKDELINFYKKYGYEKDVNFMVQRFDKPSQLQLQ